MTYYYEASTINDINTIITDYVSICNNIFNGNVAEAITTYNPTRIEVTVSTVRNGIINNVTLVLKEDQDMQLELVFWDGDDTYVETVANGNEFEALINKSYNMFLTFQLKEFKQFMDKWGNH